MRERGIGFASSGMIRRKKREVPMMSYYEGGMPAFTTENVLLEGEESTVGKTREGPTASSPRERVAADDGDAKKNCSEKEELSREFQSSQNFP